jgi:hypothetical protein
MDLMLTTLPALRSIIACGGVRQFKRVGGPRAMPGD